MILHINVGLLRTALTLNRAALAVLFQFGDKREPLPASSGLSV